MLIKLIDEFHNTVGEPITDSDGVIRQCIPGITDMRFIGARFIDPYGDTMFNPIQSAVLLHEWFDLKSKFAELNSLRLWSDIRKLIKQSSEEPHIYIIFIGD